MALSRWGIRRGMMAMVAVGLVAALAVACTLTPTGSPRQEQVFSGRTMGTYYRVTVLVPEGQTDASSLHGPLEAVLQRIESLMSTYSPDSELSRFNAATETDWVSVSRDTAVVVQQAIEVGRQSGGPYDVTVGPLVNLWTFGPERQRPIKVPSEEEIRLAKTRVGLDLLDVRLDPPTIRKRRAEVYVDLSSVAKGFGVDQVAETLDRRGFTDYCVDIGGEIRTKGLNARGIPWQIGIDRPTAQEQGTAEVVPLSDLAMATSGDYRNYFEEDGIRYCHLIDPRTGRPIRHGLASVSVVDPSCARADAWATALLVAGPEEGYALAMEQGLAALFIVKTPRGFVEKWTPQFEPLLKD